MEITKETRGDLVDRVLIYREYDSYLDTLSADKRLDERIARTKEWLQRYSLRVSELKTMLSIVGFYKGNVNQETLDQAVIDAVVSFQEFHGLDPADGICGSDCISKLRQLIP